MWLLALSTFFTVAAIVWVFVDRSGTPTDEGPAAKHVLRTDRKLDIALDRLDIPFKASEAMLAVGVAGLVTGVLVGLWQGDVLAALGAGAAVPLLAVFEVRRRLAACNARLTDQLPDALLMMTNALRAGHTLTHTFSNLGSDLPSPLGPEFARVVQALQMGASPESALQEMRLRLNHAEVDMMVQAILVQRETGGNLSEILTNIASTLRERIKLKGKVQALTAQGKLTGVVIGLLPFVLFGFLWVASRDYLQEFLTNPIGQQAMLMAALGQMTGFVLVRRIVNFKV